MANSPMDQKIQNFYQNNLRSIEKDRFLTFWKQFGQDEVIAVYAAFSLFSYSLKNEFVKEAFTNCSRAFIVGTIPLYIMRILTGGSRPKHGEKSSYWKPFTKLHGVSGHTYTGAVLFITLAKMTDPFLLKSIFYTASTLTGISRMNHNKHYLSQVLLGWVMAYVACDAVALTNSNYELTFNGEKLSFKFEF